MSDTIYYTIYKTTNVIDGKFYIGKHQTTNIYDDYLGSGLRINNAITKYGKENFKKEILFVFDNEVDMNNKEIELITEELVTSDNCYNIALGGQGGCIVLKENHPLREQTINKIRDKAILNSNEISERNKQLHKERRIGMYGKKHSAETKAKQSNAHKGKKKSPEAVQKQRASLLETLHAEGYIHPLTGIPKSDEHRRKTSENHADVSGKNNPRYGVKVKGTPTADKISQKAKERAKIKYECEHCGKKVDKHNFSRWHGDRCKHRV